MGVKFRCMNILKLEILYRNLKIRNMQLARQLALQDEVALQVEVATLSEQSASEHCNDLLQCCNIQGNRTSGLTVHFQMLPVLIS